MARQRKCPNCGIKFKDDRGCPCCDWKPPLAIPSTSLLALIVEQPGFYRIERDDIPLEYGDAEPPSNTRLVLKWGERWSIGVDLHPHDARHGVQWAQGDTLRNAMQAAMDAGWFKANAGGEH